MAEQVAELQARRACSYRRHHRPTRRGKSTLLTRSCASCAPATYVGIVAIDPSSPGGSILGDRSGWASCTTTPTFIFAPWPPAALGGLTRATADAVAVLDAAGKDVVLVETVGVGQDEVDIVRACHTPWWSARLGWATMSRRSRPESWRSPIFTWSTKPIGRRLTGQFAS